MIWVPPLRWTLFLYHFWKRYRIHLWPATMTKIHLNDSTIVDFRLDYLEVYGKINNYRELVLWLDFDNSNYFHLDGFGVMYDQVPKYEFKSTFFNQNVPIFARYKGKEINKYITTRDYFVAYGSAFVMYDSSAVISYLRDLIQTETTRRFDLALDIAFPINDVLEHFSKLMQKGAKFYNTDGDLQTYYIGEKKNSLNKMFLIRVYDKLADIRRKNNQNLYPEYLVHDNVTRIEIEFRKELSWNVTLEELEQRDFLLDLFVSYIQKHTKLFDKLQKQKQVLKKFDKKLDISDLDYERLFESRYLNIFLGYAKRIKEVGGCPIDILLRNNIFQNMTLKDISACCTESSVNIQEYQKGLTVKNASVLFSS